MRTYQGFTKPVVETHEGILHVKPMFKWRGATRVPMAPNCYVLVGRDGSETPLLLALRGSVAEGLDPERNEQRVRITGKVARHEGTPDTHGIMADITAIEQISEEE